MFASSRGRQLFLTGFFLAFIFGIPLSQAAVEIYRGRWPQSFDIFTRAPVEKNLRSFESELERLSISSHAMRPRIQYEWFSLGNPGQKAVIGSQRSVVLSYHNAPSSSWLQTQPPLSVSR